jgi:hypothetical protein
MEKIDLHNYEAFFLDYLEENLSTEQIAELDAFLMQHPELKSDLDEMQGIEELTLSSGTTSFSNKKALKADPTVLSLFTVDDWMISAVENQLSENQLVQLNEFIASNGLGASFAAYQKTVLVANESEVFTSKSALKRKAGLVIPMFYRYAAVAASVVLLIGLTVFNSGGSKDPSSQVEMIAAVPSDYKTNFTASLKSFEKSESTNEHENSFSSSVIRSEIPDLAITDSVEVLPAAKDPIFYPQVVQFDNNKDSMDVDPNPTFKDGGLPKDDLALAVPPTKPERSAVTEEPYKLFTKATGNLINRPVVFTRDKEKESDHYIAYHFKIGRFEFDRKKSK